MTVDLSKVGKKKKGTVSATPPRVPVPQLFDTGTAIMIVIGIAVATAGLIIWKGTQE